MEIQLIVMDFVDFAPKSYLDIGGTIVRKVKLIMLSEGT